ncbi:RecBCD enzyme subunit RecC [Betaproteobacteria bacterium]|nr:RecBCD enzyme subunit RecC [Betaproteobacteria bacterium]
MFSIIFSNRCENLLDALLERLGTEQGQGGPFARRQVLVPNSALRRSIELAVAAREGVCANLDLAYPGEWLWRQIGKVVDVPPRSPYAPAALAWRIFALLEEDWVAAYPRLDAYRSKADAHMRFEFARRLARLFDHYLNFRPQWLEIWRGGKTIPAELAPTARDDEAWQRELWRRLDAGLPLIDFLRRAEAMADHELAACALPASVHVFAPTGLPPRDLDLLRALARVVEVKLYVFNPCREYWCDIVDTRRLSWLAGRQQALFFETRNGLLEAWGKQTQAFIELLLEGEHEVEEEEHFACHPGRHLLAQVHNAILDLKDFTPGSFQLKAEDRSIELHLCHSRTRELEVLHDRLLALFRDLPMLRPDEVVVLTPDLAACAPLIEAVFGTAPRERQIPWRITGLGNTVENPVAQVLDRVLSLVAGRMPVSQVFDLLRQPLVAARFALDEAALDRVRGWLEGAGVRWGLTQADATNLNADPAHTFEEGFDRLFLSWSAGEAAGRALFQGHTGARLAPENSDGEVLGRLWRFVETLRHHRALLQTPHDAAGWRTVLLSVLAEWVAGGGHEPTEHAEELGAVRAAINALVDDMAAGAGEQEARPLGLDVVHPALLARLDETLHGGVPGGSVTFSALPALRGLPYRVVCVIGLDYSAFPGRDRPDEFDLIAACPHKEKGDRQRREDDRNLFLDVVLAARDVLHLSCVGRSVRDNTELPPSVVVDELFDVLGAATQAGGHSEASADAVKKRLTVVHPLQAFSADYFAEGGKPDARLESFRDDYARALAAPHPPVERMEASDPLAADDDSERNNDFPDEGFTAAAPFFSAPLAPPEAHWRQVELEQLKRFFTNPCRFLLRERLGLDLASAEDELDDAEPFIADNPARWALVERLQTALDTGDAPLEPQALIALARAGGEFPAGALGEAELRHEIGRMTAYYRELRQLKAAPRLPVHTLQLEFELDGEAWSLHAGFGDLGADGLLVHRYDDARVTDYLKAWLDHLALCAAPPAGMECSTRGVARAGSFVLRPVSPDAARRQLEDLLRLYRQGLRAPLHFSPKAAWAFITSEETKARQAARKKWEDGDYPEGSDSAYRLALRGAGSVLDDSFCANARLVFGALRESFDEMR